MCSRIWIFGLCKRVLLQMWRCKKLSSFILDWFLVYEWSVNWRCWKNKWFALIFYIYMCVRKSSLFPRLLRLLDSFAHNKWCIQFNVSINDVASFRMPFAINVWIIIMNNEWAPKWPIHSKYCIKALKLIDHNGLIFS